MNREAILIYKLFSNLEYEMGYISLETYRLRLITLYSLSDKSDEILQEILYYFDDINLQQVQYDEGDFTELSSSSNEIRETVSTSFNKEEENILYFITTSAGKISKWCFRVGDPDFFPSIPHGHSLKNNNIKLDSYLGYIYDVSNKMTKAKEIARESRQYIIDLWNNDTFRQLAIKCIDWYVDTYQFFNWRVPKNRIKILPKKR